MIKIRPKLAVYTISIVVLTKIFLFEDEPIHSRQDRFFDPNALECGKDEASHDYGVRCLYGDKNSSFYMGYTVTTDTDLDPTNYDEVDKVLQTLAYAAVMTGRLIRPRIPIIEEDKSLGNEHIQPWSVVNAGFLRSIGTDVVEPHYWARAQGARGHQMRTHDVTLGLEPIQELSNIVDTMHDMGDSIDEFVFSKDELLAIDSNGVGNLFGSMGGYIDEMWTSHFVCSEEVERRKNGQVSKIKLRDIFNDDEDSSDLDDDRMENAIYNSKPDDLNLDKLVSDYLALDGANDDMQIKSSPEARRRNIQ